MTHSHVYGESERSRFAGTVHRKCLVSYCDAISLDDYEDTPLPSADDIRAAEITEYGIDDADDARFLASRWHDGQSSAAYAYSSSGTIRRDLRDEIAANDGSDPEIAALLAWLDQPWLVVWHSGFHQCLSNDGDTVSCLHCGALYDVVPVDDDPRRVQYVNVRGEPAGYCTGDRSMAHGYPGERVCHECLTREDCSEPCEHETHDCDCLLCDS